MSRLSAVLLGSGVLLFTLTAGAQNWGGDRYDRYRGYGSYRGDPIDRTLSDLNRAASRAYLDDHERHHFDEVADNLEDFQARLARGKFDTGKLDKAIHNLEHLAQADRVRGGDRDMLSRDLYDLRQFRSTRGYYPGWR